MVSSYTATAYAIHDKLRDLVCDQSEWSQKTFGADSIRGPLGPLKHMVKEAQECVEKPFDLVEKADVFLLLLDALRRSGKKFDDLLDAATAKLVVNKEKRDWPVPTDPEEPVFHKDEKIEILKALVETSHHDIPRFIDLQHRARALLKA